MRGVEGEKTNGHLKHTHCILNREITEREFYRALEELSQRQRGTNQNKPQDASLTPAALLHGDVTEDLIHSTNEPTGAHPHCPGAPWLPGHPQAREVEDLSWLPYRAPSEPPLPDS